MTLFWGMAFLFWRLFEGSFLNSEHHNCWQNCMFSLTIHAFMSDTDDKNSLLCFIMYYDNVFIQSLVKTAGNYVTWSLERSSDTSLECALDLTAIPRMGVSRNYLAVMGWSHTGSKIVLGRFHHQFCLAPSWPSYDGPGMMICMQANPSWEWHSIILRRL